MSRPSPYCPKCKGIGWYEAPTYSHFELTVEPIPCPDCNPVQPITKVELLIGLALFALLIAFLAGGAQ